MKSTFILGLIIALCICGCRSHKPTPVVVPQGTVEFDGTLSSGIHQLSAYVDGNLTASTDGLSFPALTVPTGVHTIRLQGFDSQGQAIPTATFETNVTVTVGQKHALKVDF